jgi:hypothetical protein
LLLLRHVVRDADYSHGALAVPVRDGGFLAVVDQADCLACFPTAAAFGAHDLGLRRIGHADERNRRKYVPHIASSAIKDRSHFVKSPSENGGSTNLFTGLLYHSALDDCTSANLCFVSCCSIGMLVPRALGNSLREQLMFLVGQRWHPSSAQHWSANQLAHQPFQGEI